MKDNILIIGAGGQIGVELVTALEKIYGQGHVFASDIKETYPIDAPYIQLNALDKQALGEAVKKHQITQIYHLAAMLSATAERMPAKGWELNMESLFHVLELGKEGVIKKIFWPSSIAVFGPTTPRENTPQHTVMAPTTIYGISKLTGELWCDWYFRKHGVDVRSLRYPGLISWKGEPGGGTTDYAVQIFYDAIQKGRYTSFLSANTSLPMLYMDDSIRATLELMESPAEKIKLRTSYNLGGLSFTPALLAQAIQKHVPNFKLDYEPDYRQAIADSWPSSIDDSAASADWGWQPKFDLDAMVAAMLENLKRKLG